MIDVQRALNGYVVRTGMYTMVFKDEKELTEEILRYLENPQRMRGEYDRIWKLHSQDLL